MTPRAPVMGGEDFSRFSQGGTPVCMFYLGTIPKDRYEESRRPGGKPLPSTHNDGYAPEPAVRALVAEYSGARSEVRVVGGRDVGRPRLGHFDAFRRDPALPLWDEFADWLEQG